jgi:hypothetical protein
VLLVRSFYEQLLASVGAQLERTMVLVGVGHHGDEAEHDTSMDVDLGVKLLEYAGELVLDDFLLLFAEGLALDDHAEGLDLTAEDKEPPAAVE